MTSLTSELAARAAGLSLDGLPPEVRHWACRAIADTVACAIAGAGQEVVRHVQSVLPMAPGAAALIGQNGRAHVLDAAQLNGIAAHALDFDDCNLEMDGHPSVSIVPALIALADHLDCTGAEVLCAYVAGVEAEIRIARLSNPAHTDRGWHPTVTFGVIGAAIACARLLRLAPAQMAVAIGIAASTAAGLRANSGTMTKPLHAGQANRNGLQAALLAQAGVTANPTALEHKFGFMAAFNGAIPADIGPALDGCHITRGRLAIGERTGGRKKLRPKLVDTQNGHPPRLDRGHRRPKDCIIATREVADERRNHAHRPPSDPSITQSRTPAHPTHENRVGDPQLIQRLQETLDVTDTVHDIGLHGRRLVPNGDDTHGPAASHEPFPEAIRHDPSPRDDADDGIAGQFGLGGSGHAFGRVCRSGARIGRSPRARMNSTRLITVGTSANSAST